MKLVCLMENISHRDDLQCQHGLSLYIETERHKILVDSGANALFAENAEVLGVDLSQVDIAVLSHGHYDHAGGLSRFLELNHTAKLYIKQEAFENYCHPIRKIIESETSSEEAYKYIGIDNVKLQTGSLTAKELKNHPQVVLVSGDMKIDEELSLMTGITGRVCFPSTNHSLLVRTEDGYQQDDFQHEQSLVISEGDKRVLISGCAHCGIVNILNQYRKLYGEDPDVAVSGFHLERKNPYTKEQRAEVEQLAVELLNFKTKYDT